MPFLRPLSACLLLIAGCTKPAAPPHTSPTRFLALGDSYTIGQSVPEPDRFPNQLARLLRATGQDVSDPQIIAQTGWTTGDLSAAIDRANPQPPYPLVTLLIGVNNQYQGRSAESFRPEFTALLDRAIKLAGDQPARVIVVSIPDYGRTPFAAGSDRGKIAREIDAFNAVCKEESARRNAPFVDITPGSRAASADRSLIADDDLHPSAKMYGQWADQILPVAQRALKL